MRLLSVALHEKAAPPQPSFVGVVFRGHRERRAGVLGKAVRAMEKNAEAEKAGIENEAADTKNLFSTIRAERAN